MVMMMTATDEDDTVVPYVCPTLPPLVGDEQPVRLDTSLHVER